jgi:hypothetical protein
MKTVKINIHQGAPKVGCAYLHRKSGGLATIEINMKSKYCYIAGTSSMSTKVPGEYVPGIDIDFNDCSLYVDKRYRGGTMVEFPEFQGWSVWSADMGRYTGRICLVKD